MIQNLLPLVCGVLLAVSGAGKLFGRRIAQVAANTVLVRVLGNGHRAAYALRAVGAAELAVAAALLAVPTAVVPGVATAAARGRLHRLPRLRQGHRARVLLRVQRPRRGADRRALLRPGRPRPGRRRGGGDRGTARGGRRSPGGRAGRCWSWRWPRPCCWPCPPIWTGCGCRCAGCGCGSSARRCPPGSGGRVPVEATVELLEHSLAWQASAPIVRSALLDSWDDEGWRVLRFAGVYEDARGARPVNVLFALDESATRRHAPNPAVRVSVIDDDTEEVVAVDLLATASADGASAHGLTGRVSRGRGCPGGGAGRTVTGVPPLALLTGPAGPGPFRSVAGPPGGGGRGPRVQPLGVWPGHRPVEGGPAQPLGVGAGPPRGGRRPLGGAAGAIGAGSRPGWSV